MHSCIQVEGSCVFSVVLDAVNLHGHVRERSVAPVRVTAIRHEGGYIALSRFKDGCPDSW